MTTLDTLDRAATVGNAPTLDTVASTPAALIRVLQFADSAFPIGSFAFSDGLEAAVAEGLVRDAATLACYTDEIVRRTARTDAVAALHAAAACRRNDYPAVCKADGALLRTKLNDEARTMQRRTGRKLTELAVALFDDPLLRRWQADIKAERTPGCCPAAQGVLFAVCGLSDEALFATLVYGAANRVLNAALRCVRVSHIDTQRILTELATGIAALYDETTDLELAEMHAFSPQLDLLAALHEKGTGRMFMN